MRALDRLDIVSRKIFAGKMPGERRSKKRGQSVEFDDYRPYIPGDDLRHIDWNVLARFDRLVLKLFREDEDLGVHILLDASASMDAGEPNKLICGATLAMALGYLALVNQNRLSIATFGAPGRPSLHRMAPMRGRPNVRRVADFLLDLFRAPAGGSPSGEPAHAASFHEVMRLAAASRTGKGVVILISDMMFREGYLPGLNYFASAAGFDPYLLHVLSPGELDPAREGAGLVGDLRLTDAETGSAAEVTISSALLKRYHEKLSTLLGGLESACRAREIRYLLMPSDVNVRQFVLERVRQRGLIG